jgi:hypothetical protein
MGLDAIALAQVYQIVKNSDKMSKGLDAAEKAIINKGLELIEEAGVDPNTLPFDVRALLRGELPAADPSALLTPEVICAQPLMTVQQKEKVTRLVNSGQDKVQDLVDLTDSISNTVLKLQEPVNRLQQKIIPAEESITLTSEIVQILKLLALPTSIGTVGQPNSVNNTFASILITLSEYLQTGSANIKTVQAALGTMTSTINDVSSQVNAVSVVVNPFTTLLTMVQSIANLQDQCPIVSQGEIDAIGNNLANNIEGNLALADFISNPFADSLVALEESLQPNSPNPVVYKNFKFILEYDPDQYIERVDENPDSPTFGETFTVQRFSFPSRRIKAVRENSVGVNDGIPGYGSDIIVYNSNPQVNPDFPNGAYSYAKNVRVLIDEAKFAVDVYTANITLWVAPPVRDRIQQTSSLSISYNTLTPAQQEQYRELYGEVPPTQGNTLLPQYILYGGRSVNLNSSPTDIEFGSNALVQGSSAYNTQGLTISSYITSGTIQVNSPISIEMTTFGGNGNSNQTGADGGGSLGFTEALFTLKRSTAIQDDIDPYTGRRKDVNQDDITQLTDKSGSDALPFLETFYQTAIEDTITENGLAQSPFDNTLAGFELTGLSYIEKLKYIRDEYFGERGTNLTSMPYRQGGFRQVLASGAIANPNSKPEGIYQAIEVLFNKTKPLLFNQSALGISRRFKGRKWQLSDSSNPGDQSNRWIILYSDANSSRFSSKNWYEMARRNSVDEQRALDTGDITSKAVTLCMFYNFLNWAKTEYESLFGGNSIDYNNGAWVGGSTSIPLIPTSISSSEDVQVIQISQTAGRDETIRENIGGVEILGTYTYQLEIIDSIPEVGGAETNYPTNFTTFKIEPVNESTESLNFT